MIDDKQKLNAILDRALDAIVATDTEGKINIFNNAASTMFQYSSEEIIGKRINILMPADIAKHHNEYLRKYKITQVSKIIGSGQETYGRKKDGSIFPIWIGVNTIGKDATMGFTGVIRDLTFEKDMIHKLERSHESALQANIAKSKFLSSINHQLRTPLNSIIGFSQLLADDKMNPLNEDQLESLEFISQAGNKLLKIVNEIIDISRIDSGELIFSKKAIDTQRLINDCISFAHALAEERKIEVINKSDTTEKITGDLLRVQQTLLHLLTNAINYSFAGQSVTIVTNTLAPNHTMLRISVIDTGKGIPLSEQQNIFKAFHIPSNDEESTGIGLGLALCKKLIVGMEGKIGFESCEDKGSRFWIDLPITQTQ